MVEPALTDKADHFHSGQVILCLSPSRVTRRRRCYTATKRAEFLIKCHVCEPL